MPELCNFGAPPAHALGTGTLCHWHSCANFGPPAAHAPRNRNNVPNGTAVPISGHYRSTPPEPAQRAKWHRCANFGALPVHPTRTGTMCQWHSRANFESCRLNPSWISNYRLIERHSDQGHGPQNARSFKKSTMFTTPSPLQSARHAGMGQTGLMVAPYRATGPSIS